MPCRCDTQDSCFAAYFSNIREYLGNIVNITGTLQECNNIVESLHIEIWSFTNGKCEKLTTLVKVTMKRKYIFW